MSSRRWRVAQAIEIRWWQNYLNRKSQPEYLAWKQGYWKTFLSQVHLPLPKNLNILDAGCGPAGIFTILSGNTVTAIDPLLEQYSERLPHFSPDDYPWVSFQESKLEAFNDTNEYDLVFCLNAINHVDEWEQSINKLMDRVKTGGKLVLSTDIHRYKILRTIFRMFPGDILHPQQHDQRDYENILEKPEWAWGKPIIIKKERIFSYLVFVGEKK